MQHDNGNEASQHEAHPNCPDSLACLQDTNEKPQHTLVILMRCSILGSQRKRLTTREIFQAIEEKFPYYRTAKPSWKQSVRHLLSFNALFERNDRPKAEPGFGSYWTVNLSLRAENRRGRMNQEQGPLEPHKHITPIIPPPHHSGEDEGVGQDMTGRQADVVGRNTETIASAIQQQSGQGEGGSSRNTFQGDIGTAFDRLQEDVIFLKRQCAATVTESISLREQLDQARAENQRQRAVIRNLEDALEKERSI